MTFEERLNATPPPEVIDGMDVDLFALTGPVSFTGERDYSPPITLRWHRPDGTSLTYLRWEDEDGDRFYQPDEFDRRASV